MRRIAILSGFAGLVVGCTGILGSFDVSNEVVVPNEGGALDAPAETSIPPVDGGADSGDAGCQVAPGTTTFDDAVSISAGDSHTCAIRANGKVYCWGDNSVGQLGVPQAVATVSPKPLAVQFPATLGNETIKTIVLGEKTTYAIDTALRLWAWGDNTFGQLGNGAKDATAVPHPEPAIVMLGAAPVLARFVQADFEGACVFSSTNDIYCFGQNSQRELGPNVAAATTQLLVPSTKALNFQTAAGTEAIFSSGTGSLASCYASGVSTSNGAICWGLNLGGIDLTSDTAAVVNTQAQMPLVTAGLGFPLTHISLGTNFACARGNNGKVACWGNNNNNKQLGMTTPALGQVAVVDGTWKSVAAGYVYACVVDDQKHAHCRGANAQGQLGRRTDPETNGVLFAPVGTSATKTLDNVVSVSPGWFHACALVEGTCGPTGPGRVACWGGNTLNQLGTTGGDRPDADFVQAP